MTHRPLLVAALLTSAAVPAMAQDALTVPDIIVTAPTRTPLEAARTGGSISVVEEAALDAEPRTTLTDVLTTVPGVSFSSRGGPGASGQLSVRGFEAEDVLLRIDGIEIVDPTEIRTQADFGQILTGDVRRIEVLKGAQSALYGGEAVGGVIDLDTSVARGEGRRVRLLAEGGSFDTARGAASVGMGAERHDVTVTVQGVRSGGFSAAPSGTEDDGYRNVTGSGVGSVDLGDSATVGGALRYVDRETEFDNTRDRDVVGNLSSSTLLAGRAFVRLYALDERLTTEISAQQLFTDRDFDQPTAFTAVTRNEGERTKFEALATFDAAPGVDLLAGADWTRESSETDAIRRSGTVVDGQEQDAEIAGLFGQAVLSPLAGLTLTGALRHDEHSDFGGFTTGRATVAYEVAPGTVLRGALGSGFRAPSVQELFTSSAANADLDPEETTSWEIGVDQRLLNGRAQLSATYFESRTDNEIAFDFATGLFEQIPGETMRRGVEFFGEARVSETVALSGSYTYLDAEDPDGARLDHAPRHDAVLGAVWRATEALTVAATANYVGDESDGGVELESFTVVDLTATYALDDGIEVYGRVENLFDESYQRQNDFAQPGIGAFAGLRMAF